MAKVPNYQGIFLRGLGSQNSSHYGNVTHTSGNLGELQGDAIRNITGNILGTRAKDFQFLGEGTITASGVFTLGNYCLRYGIADSSKQGYNNLGSFSIDAAKVVPVANENRPVNIAVRYLIRSR